MIFRETALKGAWIVDLERLEDERGFFARSWCQREFVEWGLSATLVQCNISFNRKKGTLRGMHYQLKPYEEAKLIRCTMGALFDVIIDLRVGSPTFRQWAAVELSASNRRMLFIPEGFAHGFQTLEDDTEVFYQMSAVYSAGHAAGVRWDDPAFAIHWPPGQRIISARDSAYPDFVSPQPS